ncbi:MAG: hypothetical protein ACXVBX_04285 [Flavisolibacter sp.]
MKYLLIVCLLLNSVVLEAQMRFSFATDLSFMRNFSPHQQFWAVGETVQSNMHFTPRQSAYAWISYYTPAKYSNDFTASAKSPTTLPATIPFSASAQWKTGQVSLGWKHYFKGSYDAESGYNIYSIAGFGLMFTKVNNVFSTPVDTSLYNSPTIAGTGKFYRLTVDLGLGAEYPISGNFYLYGDLRTWIPTSDYPSPYLHSNKDVPLPFFICVGLRIPFY